MNPSRLFILRPVATSLLMLAILLLGLVAYLQLPVSALPEVDYPTIQVTTLYPGASPEVISTSITAPLEKQFGQMPGLKQMTSSSSGGASTLTLQFALDLDLDIAEQEVQQAINAANSFLPSDLPMPPTYSKVNPADTPVMSLAIHSTSVPLTRLSELVDTRLLPKLSQIKGVGKVSIAGGQRPAVRVQVDPQRLASFGLNIDDLRSTISNANVNMAKGSFDGPAQSATIDANDQLRSAEEYRDLIISWKSGAAIRLSDVANVVDAAENNKLSAWADKTPAIIINIQRQPGANVIATVAEIEKILPKLQAALPSSIDVNILTDRTKTIRASVADVRFELVLSIALVVMVIFIFLRNFTATLIPSVAVPLSLVGTFGVMLLAGFSINNLTLMALTIATGFVVDDAIVMIENISRYVEEGEPPLDAALKGAKQIGFTIISLTFSLIAVLIPLLFMGDVVGRLFREFSITLAVAILISAVVSLSLTPMMCARLLHPIPEHQQSWFYRRMGDFFDRVIAQYGKMLQWVLRHQKGTLWVALLTLVLTVLLYIAIPKGFFPQQDTGIIQAITETDPSTSFERMSAAQQSLAAAILEDPAVDNLSSFIGVDGNNTTLNSGRMLINLKDKNQRDSMATVMQRLQQRGSQIAGITLYMQPVQDITIEDRVSRTQYQFSLTSVNAQDLSLWTPKLLARLNSLPELADVASDLQDNGLQAAIEINRDLAGRMGISVAAIDNALYSAFGQRLISTIFTQSNLYRVVLEVKSEFRRDPSSLQQIYLVNANGDRIPLSSIAKFVEKPLSLSINHLGQFPAVTLSFNLAAGYALGDAIKAIHAAQQQMDFPPSIETAMQGSAAAFQASLTNTILLILAAIITMYIVLGVLYESYIHPVTILSTLPSAGVGALLALIVARLDLGMVAIIGIILLIGIVKKNAIMMIDFALEAEREQGKSPEEAIYNACLLRFRPIMMTTMASMLGALPLMLGNGVGSELRHPLGVTMVGGLMFSQILTLFTTPVIYLEFDRLAKRYANTNASKFLNKNKSI